MFKIIKKSKDYKQYYANIIAFRKEPKKVIRSSRMNWKEYARKENRKFWNMTRSLAGIFHCEDNLHTLFFSFSLFFLFKLKLG